MNFPVQPAVKRLGIKNEEVTVCILCALHKSVCVLGEMLLLPLG